jgi:hypothetical protein
MRPGVIIGEENACTLDLLGSAVWQSLIEVIEEDLALDDGVESLDSVQKGDEGIGQSLPDPGVVDNMGRHRVLTPQALPTYGAERPICEDCRQNYGLRIDRPTRPVHVRGAG